MIFCNFETGLFKIIKIILMIRFPYLSSKFKFQNILIFFINMNQPKEECFILVKCDLFILYQMKFSLVPIHHVLLTVNVTSHMLYRS